MFQYFALVDLHTGEYLLSHKACLDLVERSTVDKPGQIDRDRIALESRRILSHVVWEKVIIFHFLPELSLCILLFGQMIVAV